MSERVSEGSNLQGFPNRAVCTVQYKGVTGELSDEENILGSPTSSSGVWWGNKKYSGFYCIFI